MEWGRTQNITLEQQPKRGGWEEVLVSWPSERDLVALACLGGFDARILFLVKIAWKSPQGQF